MRTYEELHSTVLKHNLLFSTLDLFINYIWERTDDEITNKFTDLLHLAYIEGGEKKVITINVTTKAGIKGAIDSPPTVEGILGTAIIQFPQQAINAWEYYGGQKLENFVKANNKKYPFNFPHFRQVTPIWYWRDGNKDLHIDKVNAQHNIFNTQWHVMSNPPPANQSGNVNNWSEGCLGAEYNEWMKILPIVDKSTAQWGDKVSGILLLTEHFN